MRPGLLALALLTGACARSPAPPQEARSQTMDDLVLRQSHSGRAAWTLHSKLAILREDDKKVSLAAPTMEFSNKGTASSRVTAFEGEIEVETHDVRLSSAVVLESYDDHSRLETSEMVYSSKLGRFRTDKEVRIRRPEGVLLGKGLDASPDLTEIRIYDQRSVLTEKPR